MKNLLDKRPNKVLKRFNENRQSIYYISTDGEVFAFDKKKAIWRKINTSLTKEKIGCGSGGYEKVSMNKNGKIINYLVHRLVAICFLPTPIFPNMTEVDHMDSCKTNNHVSNLRWVTPEENYRLRNQKHSWKACSPHERLKLRKQAREYRKKNAEQRKLLKEKTKKTTNRK